MATTDQNLYDDPKAREEIKRVFGNRENWNRFCLLAHAMAAEISLRNA